MMRAISILSSNGFDIVSQIEEVTCEYPDNIRLVVIIIFGGTIFEMVFRTKAVMEYHRQPSHIETIIFIHEIKSNISI